MTDFLLFLKSSIVILFEDLRDGNLKKMVGDLHTQLRGVKTPLTDIEIAYCKADVMETVQIFNELIKEKIEDK